MSAEGKTVLVVDDEEPFLLSLVDALAPHTSLFRVVTALSGGEALDLMGRVGADLVITDLKMAGMDGVELMRRLRGVEPRLPVVVMTAYDSPDAEKELAALSPVAVLDKPIDLGLLLRTIVRTLFPVEPVRGAAGTALATLVLLTSLLAVAPQAQAGRPGIASTPGPGTQNWRIATCSDPRA